MEIWHLILDFVGSQKIDIPWQSVNTKHYGLRKASLGIMDNASLVESLVPRLSSDGVACTIQDDPYPIPKKRG